MKTLFITTCILLIVCTHSRYHSTTELLKLVHAECSNVPGLDCTTESGITIVDWNPRNEKTYDIVFVFNEHGRELITSELGLSFIKKIKRYRFTRRITILPIVNTYGRHIAETSNACQRRNENGVDLNRNFQYSLNTHLYARESEEYAALPFSEKQSKLIRSILLSGVKRYVNFHSGEWAMYTGYDYTSEETPPNYKKMLSNLNRWKGLCTVCKVGQAATVSDYKAYGTSVDFALENGVVEAYTMEIYGGHGGCKRSFNPPAKRMDLLLARWSRILKLIVETD
jgi:predicted deacylase